MAFFFNISMLILCTVYIINSGLTLMAELEDKEAELTGLERDGVKQSQCCWWCYF